MQEFRLDWAVCPTRYNPARVSFVEAEDPKHAEAVLIDHIERTEGVRISVWEIQPYTRPQGGRVIPSN